MQGLILFFQRLLLQEVVAAVAMMCKLELREVPVEVVAAILALQQEAQEPQIKVMQEVHLTACQETELALAVVVPVLLVAMAHPFKEEMAGMA
jgi:hypothetical protein